MLTNVEIVRENAENIKLDFDFPYRDTEEFKDNMIFKYFDNNKQEIGVLRGIFLMGRNGGGKTKTLKLLTAFRKYLLTNKVKSGNKGVDKLHIIFRMIIKVEDQYKKVSYQYDGKEKQEQLKYRDIVRQSEGYFEGKEHLLYKVKFQSNSKNLVEEYSSESEINPLVQYINKGKEVNKGVQGQGLVLTNLLRNSKLSDYIKTQKFNDEVSTIKDDSTHSKILMYKVLQGVYTEFLNQQFKEHLENDKYQLYQLLKDNLAFEQYLKDELYNLDMNLLDIQLNKSEIYFVTLNHKYLLEELPKGMYSVVCDCLYQFRSKQKQGMYIKDDFGDFLDLDVKKALLGDLKNIEKPLNTFQYFITTRDSYFLSTLELVPEQINIVDINRTGLLEINNLSDFEGIVEGTDWFKIYRAGRLGSVSIVL